MGRLADRARGAWVWAAQVPVVHARAFTYLCRQGQATSSSSSEGSRSRGVRLVADWADAPS